MLVVEVVAVVAVEKQPSCSQFAHAPPADSEVGASAVRAGCSAAGDDGLPSRIKRRNPIRAITYSG